MFELDSYVIFCIWFEKHAWNLQLSPQQPMVFGPYSCSPEMLYDSSTVSFFVVPGFYSWNCRLLYQHLIPFPVSIAAHQLCGPPIYYLTSVTQFEINFIGRI